jgi:hypothetical protein
MTEKKPTHAKPSLYAYYFEALKDIAKEYGYNLVVHGSMARDLDLIAIPWVDDPKPEFAMIVALTDLLGGRILSGAGHRLPGGRKSFVINLNRGGYKRTELDEIAEPLEFTPDPEYYIDISVTPLKETKEVSA